MQCVSMIQEYQFHSTNIHPPPVFFQKTFGSAYVLGRFVCNTINKIYTFIRVLSNTVKNPLESYRIPNWGVTKYTHYIDAKTDSANNRRTYVVRQQLGMLGTNNYI